MQYLINNLLIRYYDFVSLILRLNQLSILITNDNAQFYRYLTQSRYYDFVSLILILRLNQLSTRVLLFFFANLSAFSVYLNSLPDL